MVETIRTQGWGYKVLVHEIGVSKYKSLHFSSRLKLVVKGRHWRKNRRTKVYIHFQKYYKCYPL